VPRVADTEGLVVFEHTLPVAIANRAIFVFGARLGACGTSVVLVALTLCSTAFELAFSVSTADLTTGPRARVSTRFPDETVLAVTFPSTLGQSAQTAMTANLCILVGGAGH